MISRGRPMILTDGCLSILARRLRVVEFQRLSARAEFAGQTRCNDGIWTRAERGTTLPLSRRTSDFRRFENENAEIPAGTRVRGDDGCS